MRLPFTAKSLNLAGKPSRWGGMAARFFGWATVVGGLAMALLFGLLLQALFPASIVGYAVGLPILIVSLFIGISLLLGARKLGRIGDKKQRAAQLETVRALAAHRGGAVMAHEVARSLGMPEQEADALLTELAKTPGENVSLDLDDDGRIYYLFGIEGEALTQGRWRIGQPLANAGPSDQAVAREAEAIAEYQAEQAADPPLRRRR